MSKPLLSTVFLTVSISLAAWGCSSSSDPEAEGSGSEAKPGDSAGASGDQETTENESPAPAAARGEFPRETDTAASEESARWRSVESARLRSDAQQRLWRRVEEEDSAEAYVFYLDLHPSGQFAPRACRRFVELLDPIDLRSQRMQPLLARHPVAYRSLVPSLVVALDDRHFWIRLDAAILLADYNPFWWIGVVDAPVREKLVGELIAGLPALLKDDAVETRIAAARALEAIGSGQTVRPLLDALNDEAEPVRRAAAAALGAVGDPGAIMGLIGALDDPAESVAEAAAHSLGALGDPRAVKPLIEAFRKSTSPIPAQALDQIGIAAVEDLIGALDYDVQWGRQWAARSLGILQDSRAVEPLLEMFGTERDAQARRATALALGALGDARAVDPLLAVLKDPQSDGTVRAAAATALGMLDSDDPDVKEVLQGVFEEAKET
ncbi:MAG: HEAT repeat domain-containing protein, partial [Planctomycetes bacterium]|nr:HEAT repeat domain-containing protein [Planctomycetota bacterium]